MLDTFGTNAKSGTGTFIETFKADEKDVRGLIVQIGFGFYSAFMEASKVDVLARKAGEDQTRFWSSEGKRSSPLRLQPAIPLPPP